MPFQSDGLEDFFSPTFHCVKTILADSCLYETGLSELCQAAAL